MSGEPRPLDKVLEQVRDAKPAGSGTFNGFCPAHEERRTRHLRITEKPDGSVLLHCHRGCSSEAVVAALDLQMRDLFPVKPPDRPAERQAIRSQEWRILDASGQYVATHVRLEYAEGDKDYRWKRGNKWGLDGLPSAEVPLYGSERVARAGPDDDVVIVEGEKAADALQALLRTTGRGDAVVLATTTGAGAVSRARADTGPTQATPKAHATKVLEPLRGRRVFLWADADDSSHGYIGQAHMAAMAQQLAEVGAAPLKWVTWPAAPPKGDAADFAASQPTKEAVLALFKDAVEWTPNLVPRLAPPQTNALSNGPHPNGRALVPWQTAAELAVETTAEINWLWQDYLAPGTVVELDAKLKAGKSTFVGHLIKAVLEGRPFLNRPTRGGPVVYVTEEGPRTFRALLARAGLAERPDLYVLSRRRVALLPWSELVAAARAKIQATGATLLIVDTLGKCAGFRDDDENSAGKAMEAMLPLQTLATELGVVVVVVRHDKKTGGELGESARGSSAFGGDADVILHLARVGGQGRDRARQLDAIGRFDQTPERLIIELGASGYEVVGTEADLQRQQARALLLEHLPADEAEAVTLPSLWAPGSEAKGDRPARAAGPLAGTKLGPNTFYRAAEELARNGAVRAIAVNPRKTVWFRYVSQPPGAWDTWKTRLLGHRPV